jgi:hypothetical protein
MSASAVDRKDKIIGDLQDLFKLTELQVRRVYQQSEDLFRGVQLTLMSAHMSVSERFFAHARMSASDHRSRSYERS